MAAVSLSICVTGSAASPHDSARARALARLGHRVRMVSATPARLDGVPVSVPWGGRLRFGPLRRLAVMASTLWQVARCPADIVHCHYAAEYATWAAALLGKRPLVITVMGGDVLFDEQGSLGAVGRALTRFAVRRADLVTVKSPRLAGVVEAMGADPARIMTVLWGIDLAAFRPDPRQAAALRAQWSAAATAPILLSPRPLKPFYNQMLMVEALPRIVERHPDALLVLSSFGEEPGFRDALTARAGQLGIAGALRFVAPRPQADMAHLYAACDAVLSLPASDGFPQTVVEAAAAGKPCVMVGPERFAGLIADGEHALFTALDAEAVAAAALRLIEDRALAASIGAAALDFTRANADLAADARRVAGRMISLVEAR